MSKEKIYIFDTTLRDGAQTEGVNFSIDEKNKINGQVIRLALLSSHYKQPLDWNEKLVSESQRLLINGIAYTNQSKIVI